MAKQKIQIRQAFKAPVDEIFNRLTDHETFGRVIGANSRRVVDSPESCKNAAGSVRQIKIFPGVVFEETVVRFEQDRLMEYVISKGSPVKNHKGSMRFSYDKGTTRLDYTINFEPRLPFFFLGAVLEKTIETPIKKGLKRLADEYISG